uniref:Uncharacterized protein LOC110203793 n=1 Tax=Phascolarctos cinereus TaxID=38626 RepID=A0A6P5JRB9_PHACI|nr:uncharacterized protein LOC110203793 [Phascolarctos cinereus]
MVLLSGQKPTAATEEKEEEEGDDEVPFPCTKGRRLREDRSRAQKGLSLYSPPGPPGPLVLLAREGESYQASLRPELRLREPACRGLLSTYYLILGPEPSPLVAENQCLDPHPEASSSSGASLGTRKQEEELRPLTPHNAPPALAPDVPTATTQAPSHSREPWGKESRELRAGCLSAASLQMSPCRGEEREKGASGESVHRLFGEVPLLLQVCQLDTQACARERKSLAPPLPTSRCDKESSKPQQKPAQGLTPWIPHFHCALPPKLHQLLEVSEEILPHGSSCSQKFPLPPSRTSRLFRFHQNGTKPGAGVPGMKNYDLV